MDYNTNLIDRHINLLKTRGEGKRRDLILYYQVRLEYFLSFLLGYLWNKNLTRLNSKSQDYILQKVGRPSLGDLVDICRKLDIDKEIFGITKIKNSLDLYPRTRNQYLGHGYTFEDGVDELLLLFKTFNEDIVSDDGKRPNILAQQLDLILVDSIDGDQCSGVRLIANEGNFESWTCSRKVCKFEPNNLYFNPSPYEYFRLSPFVQMELSPQPKTLLYTSIQEKLTGRARYNQIFESGQIYRDWEEFSSLGVEIDGVKRKSSNGTIVNAFQNNFKEYIPLEIKKRLRKFLLDNRAFVCATVWGHGGVGKTATIQSICNDLANDDREPRRFDYIVFLTAKDRRFNFETGKIDEILFDERVESLEGIIQRINRILFGDDSTDPTDLLEFEGRLLLIIDDFETFSAKEKSRVTEFIKKLDINHHKVVVTTRANITIGEQVATNELDEAETIGFLRSVLPIEFGERVNLERFDEVFRDAEKGRRLFEITSGRPVFIFQFAHLYAANQHDISRILQTDIKASDDAVKFLYERVYEYLSNDAKLTFMILGKLVRSKDDLSHLLSKAKYVLGFENDEYRFDIAVDELVKLKIIEVREGDIFHIYSTEIWEIMLAYFDSFVGDEKQKWSVRLSRVAKGAESVEQSLLLDADTRRHSADETEVAEAYRRVLDRDACSLTIKLTALLNYAEYLFNDVGKKIEALRLFAEYATQFDDEPSFFKSYATYLWSASDIEDLTASQRNHNSSINVLNKYFSKERDISELANMELLGMLVIFRNSSLIEKLEELDTKRKYNEIDESAYNRRHQDYVDALKGVFKDGNRLFKATKEIDFDDVGIPIPVKNRTLNGLISFVDTCERLQRYQSGENVCLYIFENLGEQYAEQFLEKFKRLFASQGKSEHLAVRMYNTRQAKRRKTLEKNRRNPTVKVIKLGSRNSLPG